MLTVVTACDDKYIPGAIALFNSINANVPAGEIDFHCIYYGENPEPLYKKGIQVFDNPKYPDNIVFPIGGRWASAPGYPNGLNPSQYAMPAMYARLLIPQLFPYHQRVFWIDADCIVLKSLKELETYDMSGHPVSGVDISTELNGNFNSLYPVKGQNGNDLGHGGFGCGTLLVDVRCWNELQITEKCFDVMRQCEAKQEMLAVVQSILILVVKDDFKPLSENEYLFNVKRQNPRAETKIIHFPIMIPWDEYDLSQKPATFREQVNKYWKPYA